MRNVRRYLHSVGAWKKKKLSFFWRNIEIFYTMTKLDGVTVRVQREKALWLSA